jgi:hypothetical protein
MSHASRLQIVGEVANPSVQIWSAAFSAAFVLECGEFSPHSKTKAAEAPAL